MPAARRRPPSPSPSTPIPREVHRNGNGVWEPGETVSVEPAYANNSTLGPLTLGGSVSGLTGPSGAAYGVADGSAAYGTLAVGATGSCVDSGDCYAVSVDAPAPRPAAHWDASLDELLSTGQTRTWTLHVGDSFADVPPSDAVYAFVENIFHNGVTGGCGGGAYCAGADVSRAQMAVFLLKAQHGAGFVPPACSGVFADVACPSLFADWIEELSAEGITGGCGGGNYCPSNPVTRAQMSAFLLKARHGADFVPPACTGIFADVRVPVAVRRLDRGAVVGGNHRRLRRRQLLSLELEHSRADGGLSRQDVRPAAVRSLRPGVS